MAVDERARAPEPTSVFAAQVRATSIGLLILITLLAFEAMAVSAALPTAARDLDGLADFGWAFTGFLVANVVGMVVSGGLSDSRGPALPLSVGMIAFLAGLVTAGTATTMVQLIAGRVIQGAGGGLLITATYVVIGDVYPAALRPRLIAAMASAWVVPSVVGPLVAGLLAEHASWRWVFLGLVPFVLLGGLLMLPVLRMPRAVPHPDPRTRAQDLRRVGYALAVAAGIAVLENVGQHPSPWGYALAVPGLVAVVWGLHPLLPAGTFTVRPGVSAPIALRGVCAGAFFGIEATVPLSLSVLHGYSATLAGLPLACAGISWALGSWWQGRRAHAEDQRHRQAMVRIGFVLVAAAAVVVEFADRPSLPGWLMYPAWLLAGTGAGLAMSGVSVLMLAFTTDALRGAHSAALQLSDATVSAITTGVGGVLIAAAARGSIGYSSAFAVVTGAMGLLALVGAVTSRRLHAAPAPGPETALRP